MSVAIQPNVQNTNYAQSSQSAQKSQYSKYVRGFATSALATSAVLGTALAVNSIINSGAAQLPSTPSTSQILLKGSVATGVFTGCIFRGYRTLSDLSKMDPINVVSIIAAVGFITSDICLVGFCFSHLMGY